MMTRNAFCVFLAAFILNLIWEELHSVLYVSYQGGAITNVILFRAALFDAAVIATGAWIFLLIPPSLKEGGRVLETEDLEKSLPAEDGGTPFPLRRSGSEASTKGRIPSTSKTRVLPLGKGESRLRLFLLVLTLFTFAILLEKWALGSGRWVYSDAMPLVPLLNVGLTPAVQLGLSGYISLKISGLSNRKNASSNLNRYTL